MTGTTLKDKNLAWLIAVLTLDVLGIFILTTHSSLQHLITTEGMAMRASLLTLLPVPVLLLSSLLSSNLKAALVFWRWRNPLPGSRAFSLHAVDDSRISMDQLRKNVGEFPENECEQNSKWYALYRQVQTDQAVQDSHKNYLLFRDVAGMSLLLTVILPVALYGIGFPSKIVVCAGLLLIVQYLLSAIAGRVAGIRLVQNVLAIHASQKLPTRKSKK